VRGLFFGEISAEQEVEGLGSILEMEIFRESEANELPSEHYDVKIRK
jgi:hypothetical protein